MPGARRPRRSGVPAPSRRASPLTSALILVFSSGVSRPAYRLWTSAHPVPAGGVDADGVRRALRHRDRRYLQQRDLAEHVASSAERIVGPARHVRELAAAAWRLRV